MDYQYIFLVEFHDVDLFPELRYNISRNSTKKVVINMQACFIGHRNIVKTINLRALLKRTIELLVHNGVTVFLFGSKSEFDLLAWEIVTELMKKYPFIKRVYVRAAFQNISNSYEEYLLTSYEQTYFPSKLNDGGKFSYIERNYEMIDKSSYCVFITTKNILP